MSVECQYPQNRFFHKKVRENEAVAAGEQHHSIGRLQPRPLARASHRMGPSLQDITKIFLFEGFCEGPQQPP